MSSELLGGAENTLKGNLGGAWDIKHGYADAYTDLGIARRFGGSAAAYSLRDIGAMNGRVVKVRRDLAGEEADAEEDFSASQVQSGSLENWVNGKLENALPTDVNYVLGLEDARYFNGTNSGVVTDYGLGGLITATGSIETSFAIYTKNTAIVSFEDNSDTNDNMTLQTDSSGVLTIIHRTNGSTNILAKHTQVLDDGKLHTVRWNMTASGSQVILDGNDITSAMTFTTGSVGTVKWVSDLNSPDVLSIGYRAESVPDGFTTGVVVNTKIFGTDINTPLANYLGYGATPWVDTIGSLDGTESNITQTWSQVVGAAAAYSLRKVRASYASNAVRIRRSSDDIEVDVAFDSDDKVSTSSDISVLSGITNATDLNGFLNESTENFSAIAYGSIAAKFQQFSSTPTISNTAISGSTGSTDVEKARLGFTLPLQLTASEFDGCKVKVTGTINTFTSDVQLLIKASTAANGDSTYTPPEGNKTIASGTTGSFEYIFTGDGTNAFKSVVFLFEDNSTFDISNLKFEIIEHSATVHTWYDQAGSNNAVQATNANQPKIAENGALLADGVDFDGTNDYLDFSEDICDNINSFSGFVQAKSDGATSSQIIFSTGFSGSNSIIGLGRGSTTSRISYVNNSYDIASASALENGCLLSIIAGSSTAKGFNNAVEGTSQSSASINPAESGGLGAHNGSGSFFDGKIKEAIFYKSDQSNNRFKIESNINNYYGLYNDANDLSGVFITDSNGTFSGTPTKDGFTVRTNSASSAVRANLKNPIPSLSSNPFTFHISFNANLNDPMSSGGNASPIVRLKNASNAASNSAGTITNGFNSFSTTVNQNQGSDAIVLEFFDNDANTSYSISDIKISLIERNGFVPTWYDQSTSGNNCNQSTAGSQPFIVSNGGFCGVFMAEIVGGSEPNARNLRIDDIQTTDLGNNFGLIWVGIVDDTYSNAHPTTLVGANRNIVTQNAGTVGLNVKLSGDAFTIKNETSGSSNVNSGVPTFTYTPGDRVSVAGTCVGPDGDGDHTLKAYVNGATPVSNNDTLVLTDSSDDLRIMASNFSNTVRRDRSTIGKVDEVIIFASNIEPDMEEVRAEINNHYNIY